MIMANKTMCLNVTKKTVRRELAWSDGWIEPAFSSRDSIEFREGAVFVMMPFIKCFWVGVIAKQILFSNTEERMYNACIYDTGLFGISVAKMSRWLSGRMAIFDL